MIHFFLNSFEIGGTEKQTTELIIRLRNLNYNISLSCLNCTGDLLNRFANERIKEYRLKRFADFETAKKIFQCSNELKYNQMKIVHCSDFYTNIFGTIAAIHARIPIIINSRRDLGNLNSPAKQKLQRFVSKLSSHIVVNSRVIRDRLIDFEHVPREKISVIYNGFDLPSFCYQGSTKSDCRPFRIGMMANFNLPVKGHIHFLQTASLLAQRISQVEFLLAGEGPLRADAQQLAGRLGILDKTRFLGSVNPSGFLQSIDLLISPSLSEGMSNSIIEAMGHGVPVLATRVGGNVELIETGRTGLLVDPANPEQMAEAAIWIFNHPLNAYKIGLAGRDFIKANFSWENTCKEYQALYRLLLEKQGARVGPMRIKRPTLP